MKKRFLSILLVLCLFVSSFTFVTELPAEAAIDGFNIEGLEVASSGNGSATASNNTITVSIGSLGNQSREITFTNARSDKYTANLVMTYSVSTSGRGGNCTYNKGTVSSGVFTCQLAFGESVTFTLNSAKLGGVTAKFSSVSIEPISVAVNVQSSDNGSATVTSNSVQLGNTASFTATPDNGYRFAGWEVISGAALTSEEVKSNPLTITITQAITLKALFEVKPADISIEIALLPGGRGSVIIGDNSLVASGIVKLEADSGQTTMKAVANNGHVFAGWYRGIATDTWGALMSETLVTTAELSIDVGADDQSWTAVFLRTNTYTVSVNDNSRGTATVAIKGSSGTSETTGILSQEIVYRATPASGYIFDGWYNGDELVSVSSTYTFSVELEEDVSLQARFRDPKVTVFLGTGITSISVVDSNGTTYTLENSHVEVPSGTTLIMTATYDESKYSGIYGWYDNNAIDFIEGTASVTYSVTVTNRDLSFTVFSADTSGKMVGVCKNLTTGLIYGNLSSAFAKGAYSSGDTIVLIQAVTIENDLTIPSGVTLLVPYSSDDTGTETEVTETGIGEEFAYTLSISSGIVLRIEAGATLLVNAKQGCKSTVYQGNIAGNYGAVYVDGQIDVCGTLKARGLIKGSGRVQTYSGAVIYQFVEIADFRGGQITMDINAKMFPLNQFYIQNIQVATEYVYGSVLRGYYFVNTSYGSTGGSSTYVNLIDSGTTSLFRLGFGSKVVMRYARERNDVLVSKSIADLYGNVTVQSFTLQIKALFISVEISTKDTVCPFSAAFDVNIMEGAYLKVTQAFRFMPGVNITIHEGGTLEITSTGAAYFYDVSDYEMAANSGYCSGQYRRLPMSIGKSSQYHAETEDAVLVVNGTLIVNGGLYSSAGAGNASSSIRTNADTGIIIMNNVNTSGSSAKEYDADTDGAGTDGVVSVPFVSALGHLATSADGVWEAFGVAIYFSNGSAWYTHKTEFEQNGEVLEDLTVYGVGAYGNVDAIINGDTSSSCEFGNGYTCTHWAKESETAGTKTAPYKPYVIVYARNVSLNSTGFTLDYRLNDYIWMNASITISASGTVELADDYDGTIKLVEGTDGTYYLVRKILSTDLTTDFEVALMIDGIKTQTYSVGFLKFAEGDNGDHEALVTAMINYGMAADDYFPDVDEKTHFTKQFTFAEICTAENDYTPIDGMKGLLPARNEYNGVKLKTAGATIDFANCLGMVLRFKTTDKLVLEEGDSIAQIGFMIGTNAKYMATDSTAVELTDESYDGAFIYFGKTDGTVNGSDNNIQGINGAVSGVVGNAPADLSQEMRLRFDMTKDQYLTRFAMRPFIVILRKDGTYLNLYGEQVLYGFEDYCARIDAKTTSSQQSKNLVVYAWKYALEAARAKFEGE